MTKKVHATARTYHMTSICEEVIPAFFASTESDGILTQRASACKAKALRSIKLERI